MEISINSTDVLLKTCSIKSASDSVRLPASVTDIKGQSEALDKFKEEYEALRIITSRYSDILRADLAKIELIANNITESDRQQGECIKNGIGVFDTSVIP